jgi:predicted SprT family Zn-dependent metalloprotease
VLRVAAEAIAGTAGAPVLVVPTRNRRVMLSWRRDAGGYVVRLHRLFLEAGPELLATIGRHLVRPGADTRRALQAFFAAQRERHPEAPRPRRRTSVVTAGRHHDLAEFFTRLNEVHFAGAVEARITWGKSVQRRRRRSMRLGSWHEEERLIRINAGLDRDFVPAFFVASIVHHEMLHAHLGVSRAGGRRSVHGRAFRERERAYADHVAAERWLRENLHRLLR